MGLLLGYLVGFRYGLKFNRESFTSPAAQPMQTQASGVELSPAALEIAGDLNCVCGCNMELLPCTCADARGSKEIKMFVQMHVNEGKSKPDVLEALEEKYGKGILKKKSS